MVNTRYPEIRKGIAFNFRTRRKAAMKSGKRTNPSFLANGRKESTRADRIYFSPKKSQREIMRTRLKRISVIPVSIRIKYIGVKHTISTTRGAMEIFSFRQMIIAKKAVASLVNMLNTRLPNIPNRAKGELRRV